MSKLARALKESRTNERRYMPSPIKRMRIEQESEKLSMHLDYGTRYRIQAIFSAQVTVKESDAGLLSHYVERAKRGITHEIFGEYVGPLLEAIHLLDDFEIDAARKLLYSIIDNFDSSELLEVGK